MKKLTALLLALVMALSLTACSFVMLPEADGRTWTGCDINTLGADSRGAERIVFSNDGLIYYTGDHYKTFELLYGGE